MIRSTFSTKNKGFIEKKPIYVKNSMYQTQKLQAKTHFDKISLMFEQKQPSADVLETKCS